MTLTATPILLIVLQGRKKLRSLVRSAQKEWDTWFWDYFFFPPNCQKQLILPESLRDVLSPIKTPFIMTEYVGNGDQTTLCGSNWADGESKDLLNTYCIKKHRLPSSQEPSAHSQREAQQNHFPVCLSNGGMCLCPRLEEKEDHRNHKWMCYLNTALFEPRPE